MSGSKPFRTCRDAVRESLPFLPPSQSETVIQRALAFKYVPLQEAFIAHCACAERVGMLTPFLDALPAGAPIAREYERDPAHTVDELRAALGKLFQNLRGRRDAELLAAQEALGRLLHGRRHIP